MATCKKNTFPCGLKQFLNDLQNYLAVLNANKGNAVLVSTEAGVNITVNGPVTRALQLQANGDSRVGDAFTGIFTLLKNAGVQGISAPVDTGLCQPDDCRAMRSYMTSNPQTSPLVAAVDAMIPAMPPQFSGYTMAQCNWNGFNP